MQLCA